MDTKIGEWLVEARKLCLSLFFLSYLYPYFAPEVLVFFGSVWGVVYGWNRESSSVRIEHVMI